MKIQLPQTDFFTALRVFLWMSGISKYSCDLSRSIDFGNMSTGTQEWLNEELEKYY